MSSSSLLFLTELSEKTIDVGTMKALSFTSYSYQVIVKTDSSASYAKISNKSEFCQESSSRILHIDAESLGFVTDTSLLISVTESSKNVLKASKKCFSSANIELRIADASPGAYYIHISQNIHLKPSFLIADQSSGLTMHLSCFNRYFKVGESIDIDFENSLLGENIYLSCLIMRGTAALYYGRLSEKKRDRTLKFTVPTGLESASYKLLFFNEICNGALEADFAYKAICAELQVK